LPVAGRPLLDHALDMADEARIAHKVINTSYLGEMIHTHLASRADIAISHETGAPLETGGGMKRAAAFLGDQPVLTLNPDAIWTGMNPLAALCAAWRPADMAALLMLIPTAKATAHAGRGDFVLGAGGQLERYNGTGKPLSYTGAEIIDPAWVMAEPSHRFSLNIIWDRMIEQGRLFGCVHHGDWADVGTPEGITAAENMLAADV